MGSYISFNTIANFKRGLEDTDGVFFICDTETTGLSPTRADEGIPNGADVIEITAIKVELKNGRFNVLDIYDEYINPCYPLPQRIVEFNEENGTGVDDEFLADKPLKEEVSKRFLEFIGDSPILVGHNFEYFDIPFIQKLTNNELYCAVFDTLKYARANYSAEKNKLSILHAATSKEYSPKDIIYHNSVGDCYATLDLLWDFYNDTYKVAKDNQKSSSYRIYL